MQAGASIKKPGAPAMLCKPTGQLSAAIFAPYVFVPATGPGHLKSILTNDKDEVSHVPDWFSVRMISLSQVSEVKIKLCMTVKKLDSAWKIA